MATCCSAPAAPPIRPAALSHRSRPSTLYSSRHAQLAHSPILSSTIYRSGLRLGETKLYRIVWKLLIGSKGGRGLHLIRFCRDKERKISFEEISRTGILEEILIVSFPSLLVLIFFSIIRSRDVNSGTIIVNVIEYRNARIVFSSYLFSRWSQKFRLKMEGKTNVSQRNRRNR